MSARAAPRPARARGACRRGRRAESATRPRSASRIRPLWRSTAGICPGRTGAAAPCRTSRGGRRSRRLGVVVGARHDVERGGRPVAEAKRDDLLGVDLEERPVGDRADRVAALRAVETEAGPLAPGDDHDRHPHRGERVLALRDRLGRRGRIGLDGIDPVGVDGLLAAAHERLHQPVEEVEVDLADVGGKARPLAGVQLGSNARSSRPTTTTSCICASRKKPGFGRAGSGCGFPTWPSPRLQRFRHCRRAAVGRCCWSWVSCSRVPPALYVGNLLDYWTPYFNTPTEVETVLDIPVLATLAAGR